MFREREEARNWGHLPRRPLGLRAGVELRVQAVKFRDFQVHGLGFRVLDAGSRV